MDLPLLTALAGAAAGASVPFVTREEAPDAEQIANNTFIGAVVGASGGRLISNAASWFKVKKLKKELGGLKDVNPSALKALAKASKRSDVPIYIQTGGKPIDNAFYQITANPALDSKDFKLLVKGRKDSSVRDADTVVIGKNFRKLPVVAHELGHASDFNENKLSIGEKWLAPLGVLATAGAFWTARAMEPSLKKSLTLLAAATLGLGTSAYTTYKTRAREREASKRALEFIQRMKRTAKEQAQARQFLETAYSTYDPIRIGSKPPFLMK